MSVVPLKGTASSFVEVPIYEVRQIVVLVAAYVAYGAIPLYDEIPKCLVAATW